MHILVVASNYPGTADSLEGIFSRDQARALQKAGHTVTYAAIDLRSLRRRRKFGLRHFVDDGLDVYLYSLPVSPLRGAYGSVGGACFCAILRRVCAEHGRPDIVHAHFLGTASIVAPVCRDVRLPLVITEHSSAVNKAEIPPKLACTMRETYQKADTLFAVSHALAENIHRHTGIIAKVVPNIADIACFTVKEIRHDGFRFVSAGNLIPIKNMAGLLEAFAMLPGEPELVIFGDGTEKDALRGRCESLGLCERVIFRGLCPRKELAAAYAAADAFVLASKSETFGVAYVEAMAAGLPVIATRCGGPEDFVTEENGLLVPVDDMEALAGAMEHVMLHRTEYDSAAIAAEIRRKFAPETIAAQLTAVYEEIVSC